jgi:hypothetical protein
MAVIKYQINGKADTKPIKDTEKAAQGMFQKIQSIDNTLKAFVGVKIFQEVGKAVKTSLAEYDKFKASLKEETNLSKQFDNIKTAMAGTLGTVRDELFKTIGDITGADGFKSLEETIPKIGAALIASLKVAAAIVVNIKDNFSKFLNPKIWEEFFTSAKNLGSAFVAFLGSGLKDAFKFAVDFFKWAFEGINLLSLVWEPIRGALEKVTAFLGSLGVKSAEDASEFLKGAKIEPTRPAPRFALSDETKNAFKEVVADLGETFKTLLDTVAGTDVQKLYDEAYGAALDKLNATIGAMKDDGDDELAKALRELKDALSAQAKNAASAANDKFSNAASYIEGILGNATAEQAEKIREKMEGLNKQFVAATGKIKGLFEELENAKDATAVENAFKKINEQIGKINELSESMSGLDTMIEKFDLLGSVLGMLGDAGAAINAILSSNPLGLILQLVSRLFETFAKISGPFAAFMNIFDVFFDVVEEVCAVLEPALSAIFKPIVDIVRQLGIVFGVFLNMLSPVLQLVGMVASAIQILSPILYGIAAVFAAVADGFGHVYNTVSSIVRKLTFGLVNMGSAATDNRKRLKETWEAEMNYDEYKSSNNSTSYSVAGDMYININFSHSYVNGDAREIARMLRDEIRLLEAQGY